MNGHWDGSQFLNWGEIDGELMGAVHFGDEAITFTALLFNTDLADVNGGMLGGLDPGELFTFYVQSKRHPRIFPGGALTDDLNNSFGEAFAPIPEPGTIVLVGSGLVALYGPVRRLRKAAAGVMKT